MKSHLRANLWLLLLTLVICSVLYPGVLWVIAQTVFPNHAQGSLVDKNGQPASSEKEAVGSRLIAQPFTGAEYFQPRPSAASYNAAASAASNWGASNYLLRERVARQLGPIVKYRGGAKKGQPVAPDIEAWFQKDRFQNKPGIVTQWAQAHPNLATNWVKADPLNLAYVAAWQKAHTDEVAAWIKENPGTPEPKPEDLALPFFVSYATAYPGTFPGPVEHKTAEGKNAKRIEPLKEGNDIQGIFFDMWLQEHADADLVPVPADMVMASASGLDPHITLMNAHYQLERVAAKWAETTKRAPAEIRTEIESLLREQARAPLAGLAGVELINVLELNLSLRKRYGS